MKYTSSFEEIYHNGYTSENRSLLEAETINQINSSVNDEFTKNSLPPCHLNFGNFGDIQYDWMDITARPVNYKLFNKLQQLSSVIRNINQAFISLILEFKCCGIAGLYNDNVIPIFEWVLQDFIGVLVDIASGIIQGNQAFKILTCAVKPVPGNPWLKQGGMDYLNMIYSYLNGFEAIYNWIMDGNPVDMILNPVNDFYKKITSCTPKNEGGSYSGYVDDLGGERLKELLDSYEKNINDSEISEDKKEEMNEVLSNYRWYKRDRFTLYKELNTLQNTRTYYIAQGATDEAASTELVNKLSQNGNAINSKIDEIRQLEADNTTIIKDSEAILKAANQEQYIQSQSDSFTNDLIVQRTIDQLIIDKFDPSCSCLTGILGLGSYKPPAYKTVSTWEDVDKLNTTVHWSDKDLWKSSIEDVEEGKYLDADVISNIYINRTNISDKYKSNNSVVDRDNLVTVEVQTAAFDFGFGLDNTELNYNYVDINGQREDHTIDIVNAAYDSTGAEVTEFLGASYLQKLYSDSGHSTGIEPHKADDISTVFELNLQRQNEMKRLNILLSKAVNDKLQIEYNFEKVWNSLRQAAIDKTKFETFNSHLRENDDTDFYDLDLFDSKSYSTGFDSTIDFLEGTALLAKLGSSFDMVDFLQNFHEDDLDVGQTTVYDISGNKVKWETLSEKVGILEAAISKLELLIRIDNVVIEIVDDGIMECGCDILCKILQWILDIILSTVKALVESIVAKILKMVMNEHVAYIIKFILHQLQCIADISAFEDNIKEIREKADALKESNARDLIEMQDPIYCSLEESAKTLGQKLIGDEIPLYDGVSNEDSDVTDTTTYPDPTFGELSPDNTPESGNIISNQGGIVVDLVKTGQNIPEVILDCTMEPLPFMEIEIEPRDSYEILVAFKPSDYILEAEVIEIEQGELTNSNIVTDPDGNEVVVQTVTNQVNTLTSILEQANKKVEQALNAPVYEETDCTEVESSPNNMTLCSTENLWIESVYIIDSQGDEINDFENYGTITQSYAGPGLFEYFPEDDFADENGMVPIAEGTACWTYEIPEVEVIVGEPVVTNLIENVDSDTDTTPYFNTSTSTRIESFSTLSTETSVSITYVDNNGQLEKHTETTTTLTVYSPFRFPDLEILGTFRNKVNHLSIRFILDVLGAGEPSVPALFNAEARYVNMVELGSMDGSGTGIYNISERRLLFLSQQLLKDNNITSNPKAVAKEAEAVSSVDPNECLLPESQAETVKVNSAIVENLTSALEETLIDIDNIVTDTPVIEMPEPETITLPTLKKSIPLVVLNKEKDIVIQIVDRKLFLQFKSNVMVNTEPLIIDFELVPDDTYMLIFNTNNLVLNMSLITPDKQLFSTSGINTSGAKLLPSIIGGNLDGTQSFCGTIIDVILSESGSLSNDFYNRSLLSYIPRTAKVIFDFSVSDGSRVYNTINKVGADFTKNTDVVLDRFKNPIPNASQKADMYGEIKSNAYYQVLNGYMDNFFCRENLEDKDFTVSIWIYKLDVEKTNRHMILSDDINQNYIYYDAIENLIYLNFKGVENETLFLHFDSWTHLTFKHNLFSNRYILTIQKINGESLSIAINTKSQFSLMSIFAEYDYDNKRYINEFGGLLSTVSIFFNEISSSEYNVLHNEQKILVRGMEL